MQNPRFATLAAFFIVSTVVAQSSLRAPQTLPGTLPMVGGNTASYCTALPNSSGASAHISHSGSLTLADGSFQLSCSGLPVQPGAHGVFTYGQTQMNTPFGNGYLCIQPLGGIYRMAAQPLSSPTVSRGIAEAPAQFQLFQPASTWNFQFWYRDVAAGGSNFNLSDGLSVQFGV